MRHLVSAFSISVSVLFFSGCGATSPANETTLADDTQIGLLARFGAPELLEVLAQTPDNNRMPSRGGVTESQIAAAFDSLDGKLIADGTLGRLRPDDTFARSLTPTQKNGIASLQRGYDLRMREGSIKLQRTAAGVTVVPTDGRYTAQGDGIGLVPFDNELIGTTANASGEGPGQAPDHRVGDGRWSWRLSYKWWGVRLGVNHNFLNYLCNNTDWMLARAGLPGWIKLVVRPLGCILHSLDSGADGSSISITWTGAFWYTP